MWQFSIIYDLFFSFCVWSAFIYVFELFPSFLHWPTTLMNPTTDTINLFPALLTKTFLNFTLCFFCHLPVAQLHLSLLCPTTSQQKKKLITTNSTLCLSLYLSYLYKQERVTNIEWQSHKAKKPKKKKKKKTTGSSNTKSIHNHQHQFSSSLISKNTNMKHHKSTSPQGRTTQAQFLLSMNLRFSDHKVTNILLGFEIWRKREK